MNRVTITDVTHSNAVEYLSFSWIDYTLFILMFGFSIIIGVYYGCFGNKQSRTENYLHGGKKMKAFPVAMSLAASSFSGISLIGIPAEIYMHGTQYSMCMASCILFPLLDQIFLPVFYKLQLMNVYEYLEMRFNRKIRLTASALYVLTTIIYIPIVIYVPALAFNQVTGINIYVITPIISLFCIFYTTIGGFKAVVWADTLQLSVTMVLLGLVLVMGTISVGGFAKIWEKAALGDRLEFFNMNPDPTLRQSFWSIVIGNTLHWISQSGCHPATAQRFIALPTLRAAIKAIILSAIIALIINLIMCFSGLILFTKYFECDPLTSGSITKPDQILPYYVMDVANTIPGLGGLFVAGIFSTSFTTLSTILNTLSVIIYADFIKPFLPVSTSELKSSSIMKMVVVILGIVAICLVFVVDKLGTILELNVSSAGITVGPLMGVFLLGMLFPMANKNGAICGSLGSVLILSWIVIKTQLYNYSTAFKGYPKPLNTYGCDNFNVTNLGELNTSTFLPSLEEEEPFWIFRITFYYYALIGIVLTLAIGLPVSWFTKQDNTHLVDLDLLSPVVKLFVKKSVKITRSTSVDKRLCSHAKEIESMVECMF